MSVITAVCCNVLLG